MEEPRPRHCCFHSFSGVLRKGSGLLSRNTDLRSATALHAHLITTGLIRRLFRLASKFVPLYASHGRLKLALHAFDEMPETSSRRWIVLIGTLANCGFSEESIDTFRSMRREGWPSNGCVVPSVLKSCARISFKEMGSSVHAIVVKCSFQNDSFVCSSLVNMYSKCGSVDEALCFFHSITRIDLVSLNAMVSGLAQHGFSRNGFDLMNRSRSVGVRPNVITWNTLIAGFAREGCDDWVVAELFKSMRKDGSRADVVSWTSFVSGLVRNLRFVRAFEVFGEMVRQESATLLPNSDTISALLPACSGVADLRKGEEIHGYAVARGMADDVYVGSSLIDMYAKCGSLFRARRLFAKMPTRNTVSWNSMIFGLANNGCSEEAIRLFGKMETTKQKVDHLTFTAALMASSHAGMVEHGNHLFHRMQTEFGIRPRMEHYAAMVDLLGRAGDLDEAYGLIKMMPIKPDVFVWGALLGACRIHGDLELAEIAAEHLTELEPDECSGGRRMMKELYTSAGRFKTTTTKTTLFPSRSWIEAT